MHHVTCNMSLKCKCKCNRNQNYQKKLIAMLLLMLKNNRMYTNYKDIAWSVNIVSNSIPLFRYLKFTCLNNWKWKIKNTILQLRVKEFYNEKHAMAFIFCFLLSKSRSPKIFISGNIFCHQWRDESSTFLAAKYLIKADKKTIMQDFTTSKINIPEVQQFVFAGPCLFLCHPLLYSSSECPVFYWNFFRD